MARAFRQLPSLPGVKPTPAEVRVFQLVRRRLLAHHGPLPRFVSLEGAAVAVVEDARGEDGAPCVGLAVEIGRPLMGVGLPTEKE